MLAAIPTTVNTFATGYDASSNRSNEIDAIRAALIEGEASGAENLLTLTHSRKKCWLSVAECDLTPVAEQGPNAVSRLKKFWGFFNYNSIHEKNSPALPAVFNDDCYSYSRHSCNGHAVLLCWAASVSDDER